MSTISHANSMLLICNFPQNCPPHKTKTQINLLRCFFFFFSFFSLVVLCFGVCNISLSHVYLHAYTHDTYYNIPIFINTHKHLTKLLFNTNMQLNSQFYKGKLCLENQLIALLYIIFILHFSALHRQGQKWTESITQWPTTTIEKMNKTKKHTWMNEWTSDRTYDKKKKTK